MKSKKLLAIFCILHLAFYISPASANENPIRIIGTAEAGSFLLAAAGQATGLVIDPNDAEVVAIAAEAFSKDVEMIAGVKPSIAETLSATPVIIGTLNSSFISQLVTAGKLDASQLAGKWETFLISVIDSPLPGVEQALVIAGSDPRGTAFGVFELSRRMGVSPWVYWADVTPERRDAIYVTPGQSIFGPPSVQYRGLFINDEDWAMQPWAARNMDRTIRPNGNGDMGPQTYAKIFELMLRMKSNYLWPAMHACTKAFWFYPENPEMARKYSIVLGSSHCEQMLRDNEDEWRNNFQSEYGHASGDWNWATNSANITKYWTDRVKQAVNTEAVYTMGMRGIHDSGIPGYNTDEERVGALESIIPAQRNILTANLEKPVTEIPQVFIPYKEVLRIYNLGVEVPDDITLMWADDNFGYMRQLSNPAEQARSGGGGVYYHFSYLGPPNSYLWLASVPVSVAAFELRKAYELNCKRMWIFNVGDIKPQEFELQFAMDLAWDIHSVDMENPNLYAKQWGAETFGEQFQEQIYQIKREYFRMAAAGKPECIAAMSFSVAEMEQRIADYETLVELSQTLEVQIPERLQDAYFQLVKYPVEGAANMNYKQLYAKLSYEYGAQARKSDAVEASSLSIAAFNHIIDLTKYYNNRLANGKWNGMMSYSPNNSAYFHDPTVINKDAVSQIYVSAVLDSVRIIPAENYTTADAAGQAFKIIDGLGITNGITVFPYNMTAYTADNITSAPSLEYDVPVLKGTNELSVLCLPSFPLYKGLKLRYAVSIDNAAPVFCDLESDLTGESSALWGQNVMQGYASGVTKYESDDEKTVKVKVWFPDPALVVSAIKVTATQESPLTSLIVNNSFEYADEETLISSIPNGTDRMDADGNYRIKRNAPDGELYGWNVTNWNFRSSGNYSQGINKDMTARHGDYGLWIAGDQAFSDFWEFYQVIPAESLEPGAYKVQCRLAVEDAKRTSQRLFANQNVQYHGSESQYANNLTAGEINTFAGYPSGASDLREMTVYTVINEGDSLKIGVRTGRIKGDGTAAGNASPLWGWFKIDYFRIEKVEIDSIETGNDPNDYTSRIVNPSFEYKSEGVLNDGSTVRGTPYGWSDTGIGGNSFGINNDAVNIAGTNCCWYLLNGGPFPANFELYQNIDGLPAGRYKVDCSLAVMDGRIAQQRLFANNSVQYFGHETDYGQNLVANENASFAGWNSTGARYLKDLSVEVAIAAGESLKTGVRSGNIKADGQPATDDSGWFKVDDFRLTLLELHETGIETAGVSNSLFETVGTKGGFYVCTNAVADGRVAVYSLIGSRLFGASLTGNRTFVALPQGIYIVQVTVNEKVESRKVFIK
ncbi:MAG: glycosyl hydrolase 115 family protein [Dysgonamonadaceae bacterium]|jgi:hypothetical protein|nr:glycosyl hydrolase 115 family protein [Dysgonamonadaceae bacterium]